MWYQLGLELDISSRPLGQAVSWGSLAGNEVAEVASRSLPEQGCIPLALEAGEGEPAKH